MSETQFKVTGSFQATDENGNKYIVNEYTLFRHTTTFNMEQGVDGTSVEYRLGNGTILKQISETEFEITSDGTRLHKSS